MPIKGTQGWAYALALPVAALTLLTGCGGSSDDGATSTAATGSGEGESGLEATALNVHKLPLGDDMYETGSPKRGYVYSCITDFSGSGAFAQGPWIDAENGTWDLTEKIYVEGQVSWDSEFSQEVAGSERELEGNGLPPQPSGEFPVQESDPAYEYDRNPNSISEYTLKAALPANPQRDDEPSCIGGTVGVMKSGVPLFSAFDAGGRDAVATEIQDNCDAHPEKTGQYHYHGLSSCLYKSSSETRSELLGWALDGFGIYVERDSEGTLLSSADLDICHGRTSTVEWNGKKSRMYHYVLTLDFPYTVACYRGTAITEADGLAIGSPGAGIPEEGGPPGTGPPGT
ncbi:MAG: YHYH protein [Solirubrobacterales bacterium]|nr:YHYH protein [Solirubrobacterales bacterium]